MMKRMDKSGMSLIELIVALAILGIITVAFLSGFTGAFSTILGMGRKTTAMASAQTIIDKIYESGDASASNIQSLGAVNNFSPPYSTGNDIRYELSTKTIDGHSMAQVAIRVFYQNGKNYVTLTSLVP